MIAQMNATSIENVADDGAEAGVSFRLAEPVLHVPVARSSLLRFRERIEIDARFILDPRRRRDHALAFFAFVFLRNTPNIMTTMNKTMMVDR